MANIESVYKLFDGYSNTSNNFFVKASASLYQFNIKLESTGKNINKKSVELGSLIGKFINWENIQKGMSLADSFINTSSKISLINDGLQTQAELQQKIFAVANRSKGTYTDMAGYISQMGPMVGDKFKSNDELIAFTELSRKSLKTGGASSSEQSDTMTKLTESMSSGKLEGDDFSSIMKNAPLIGDAISKYVGVSKGELKTLSSEGAITSDIIKNAIFAMSDDINSKFETMPTTFADVGNRIKNVGLQAFGPVIEKVSSLINSEGFNNFISIAITAINVLGAAMGFLIDFTIFFWDLIEPFLVGLTGALLPLLAESIWALVAPILTMAYAWVMANLPLILLIATIFLVIKALASLGVTFRDVVSFIGGILGTLCAFFYNIFVSMWNDVARFVNFFGNVFNHPIAAVQTKFLDMAVSVLGFIESLAKGIEDLLNKIPGVEISITGSLTAIKNNLSNKSATIKSEVGLIEYVKTKDFMDYSSAANKGSEIGSNLFDKVSSVFENFSGFGDSSNLGFDMNEFGDLSNSGFDMNELGTTGNPLKVEGIGSNGSIEVNMADEDLKYMRDIAEREYINKFSNKTLAPQISVSFGDVRETADVNQVAKRISRILKEEIEITGEGIA